MSDISAMKKLDQNKGLETDCRGRTRAILLTVVWKNFFPKDVELDQKDTKRDSHEITVFGWESGQGRTFQAERTGSVRSLKWEKCY